MDSSRNESEIVHDVPPLLRVYKDGHIERLIEIDSIPPSIDPTTGVESKDITIIPETGVSARLFKPSCLDQNPKAKVPILVYFHGGGFCYESTFSPLYHPYLNSLASQARILIVSVEYRLTPEHLLPAAYDDGWAALNWVISHSTGDSFASSYSMREPWLLDNVDFGRVYLAGDSAGANISHHVSLRIGNQGLADGSIHGINGIILFHPFFWGSDRIGDETTKLSSQLSSAIVEKVWTIACPASSGMDHPFVNPATDSTLSRLGCESVLIFVAEKDLLRDRGVYYKEILEKSGWQGKVEVVETLGEDHVFYLFNPSCANAAVLMSKVVDFLNPAAAVDTGS